VLSSIDKKETEQKCKELGIKEYFQQPFSPVELEKAVERLLKYEKNELKAVLKAV